MSYFSNVMIAVTKKDFEKIENELKDGYVFCRLGEETMDIEFKKRTKLPELMTKFEFIKDLSKNLNKELKKEEEEEFE